MLTCANCVQMYFFFNISIKSILLQSLQSLFLHCLFFFITVFDLITAHTPISAQSRNSVVFRLQPVYFFLYFFTKAYFVGTHLNCIDKSMQFK